MPNRFVLATANLHKAGELAEILAGVELVPRPADVPDVVEDADTLIGNARLKANALVVATGEAALADDTGLEVDALGGAPGVRSARYAGSQAIAAENVAKLLRELHDRGADACADRAARFRTVLVARWPDGHELWTEGVVEGRIADRPGGANGFGYDPVFVPTDGDGRSFAEMTSAEKHTLSHRGRAARDLARRLAVRPHS